jgi:hypothetical protein
MKILNLYDTYRTYLENKMALDVDANGDEVLVGLNRSESIEYVDVTNGSLSDPLFTGHDNPLRFIELYERHQAALPKDILPFYLKESRFI